MSVHRYILGGAGSAAQEATVGVLEGNVEAPTGAVLPGPGSRGEVGEQSVLPSLELESDEDEVPAVSSLGDAGGGVAGATGRTLAHGPLKRSGRGLLDGLPDLADLREELPGLLLQARHDPEGLGGGSD